MIRKLRISILATFAAVVAPTVAQPADDLEWTNLFTHEGPVTDGWTTRHWADVSEPPERPVEWEVRDGILYGTGQHNTPDDWAGTWLLSERQYGDFVLELDFRFQGDGSGGNGGVALRAPLDGDPAYDGLELQITDPQYEFGFFPGAGADELTGALYLVQPPRELVYRANEWNHYRIDMRGPKVKVWLNDALIQNIDLTNFRSPARKHGEGHEFLAATPGNERPRRGHIGFQDLSNVGEVLIFRNIRIAPLD